MPTVMTILGLRVAIYPNDHRPAHVHVIGQGCEAVFDLHCPKGPPELRENFGFSQKGITKIVDELVKKLAIACKNWSNIHGNY